MKNIAFISLLWCFAVFAQAESLVLTESQAASQIARGFNIFRDVQGMEPETWAEIESVFSHPLNELNKEIQPTTRYAFLDEPLEIPDSNETIVILSRSPAHDQYKMRGIFGPIISSLPSSLERYAIVILEDGEAYRISYPETQIQKIFLETGMALPSPDPLGLRPYEITNRFNLILLVGVMLLTVSFAVYLVAKRIIGEMSR